MGGANDNYLIYKQSPLQETSQYVVNTVNPKEPVEILLSDRDRGKIRLSTKASERKPRMASWYAGLAQTGSSLRFRIPRHYESSAKLSEFQVRFSVAQAWRLRKRTP